MVVVRALKIENFRGIRNLTWFPHEGINCLVGPGDAGKSTILVALDFVLGQRKLSLSDADFHTLDTDEPVVIEATLGNLDQLLLNVDHYGWFHRGFDHAARTIEDEPGVDLETVLTVRLVIDSSLDPDWTLYSKRAAAIDQRGVLRWEDRRRLKALWIGASASGELSWRQGSVFMRMGDADGEISPALADATRAARDSFGDNAAELLEDPLQAISNVARRLGVPLGDATALLDPGAISLSGGAVSVHGENGIPVRALGLGSTRLLVAALQRQAANSARAVLVDEIEHGLEPHRIIRFLHELGSQDAQPSGQCFTSTHSPVVIREIDAQKIYVVRVNGDAHEIRRVPSQLQGLLREHPEALLAPRILLCEGKTEMGFMRGLDRLRAVEDTPSLYARGVALVDAGGISKTYPKAIRAADLGYSVAVLHDSDEPPSESDVAALNARGGLVVAWPEGRTFEDEVLHSSPDGSIPTILEIACNLWSHQKIDDNIKSASNGALSLDSINREPGLADAAETRAIVAQAAKSGEWFKRIDRAEALAVEGMTPTLEGWAKSMREPVESLWAWMDDE